MALQAMSGSAKPNLAFGDRPVSERLALGECVGAVEADRVAVGSDAFPPALPIRFFQNAPLLGELRRRFFHHLGILPQPPSAPGRGCVSVRVWGRINVGIHGWPLWQNRFVPVSLTALANSVKRSWSRDNQPLVDSVSRKVDRCSLVGGGLRGNNRRCRKELP